MIQFTEIAWEQYLYWQQIDRFKVKKINSLIKEVLRTPFEGTGKPEPLKNELSGFWSRRIDLEHRMVYKFENNILSIISCRFHY
jgi:toxin YoeB